MSIKYGLANLMHNIHELAKLQSQSSSSPPPTLPPIWIPPPPPPPPLTGYDLIRRLFARTPYEYPQLPDLVVHKLPSSDDLVSNESPQPPNVVPPPPPPPSSAASSEDDDLVSNESPQPPNVVPPPPPSSSSSAAAASSDVVPTSVVISPQTSTISAYKFLMQNLPDLDSKKSQRLVAGSLVVFAFLLASVGSMMPHLQGANRTKLAKEVYHVALTINKGDFFNKKNLLNILPLCKLLFNELNPVLQAIQAGVSLSNLMSEFLKRKEDEQTVAELKELKQHLKEIKCQVNALKNDKLLIIEADVKDKDFIIGEREVTGYFFLPEDTKVAEDVKVCLKKDHKWMVIKAKGGKDIEIKLPSMVYTRPSTIQALFCDEPVRPKIKVIFKKILRRRTPKNIVRLGSFYVKVRSQRSDNRVVNSKKADEEWVEHEGETAKEKDSSSSGIFEEATAMFSNLLDAED